MLPVIELLYYNLYSFKYVVEESVKFGCAQVSNCGPSRFNIGFRADVSVRSVQIS